MDLITVVIPVYNIEKYIKKCVDSVIRQSYRNLQIILVDDGSTDNSGRICDELAEKDSRIQVIHKENGGLSDARNAGLDRAAGKYIGFVDGDDYIDEDMFEVLYSAIWRDDIDMASCGYYEEFADKVNIMCCSKKTVLLDRKQAYQALFNRNAILGCSSCNKLFKKELFGSVRYKKGIQSEDLELIYRIIHSARYIVCVNSVKYHYYHRPESITTRSFNKKSLDFIKTMDEIILFINHTYPDIIKQAYSYRLTWLLSSLRLIYASRPKKEYGAEKKLVQNKITADLKYYWNNPYIYSANYVLLWSVVFHLYAPVQWLLDKSVLLYHGLKGAAR